MAGADEARVSRAADVLAAPEQHAALLRTIVEVARAIFGAKAASIMLYDEATDELVFEAVIGAGEQELLGKRIPAGTGVAGWVLASQEPLVIEDVEHDPRFARDVAERSGYVPKGLMAAPLLEGESAIGVLSVLDRPRDAASPLPRWTCSPCSRARLRSRSSSCAGHAARRRSSRAPRRARSASSPRRSSASEAKSAEPPRSTSSRRSRSSCDRIRRSGRSGFGSCLERREAEWQ